MGFLRTVKRSVRSALGATHRLGLDIRPVMVGPRKLGGVRFQWKADRPEVTRCAIVSGTVEGKPVNFVVMNEIDVIQKQHMLGKFYEEEELELIARHFKGGTFVDIGTNIGNHTIYAAKFLDASKVIAFEPNREALRILKANLALNDIAGKVVLHEAGLSDSKGRASVEMPRDNLGGARLSLTDDEASIAIERGDDMLRGETIEFIKIDTEGMEMGVLEGLRETIADQKPTIFVEVENANIEAFHAYRSEMGYEVVEEYRRYDENINYLVKPAAK